MASDVMESWGRGGGDFGSLGGGDGGTTLNGQSFDKLMDCTKDVMKEDGASLSLDAVAVEFDLAVPEEAVAVQVVGIALASAGLINSVAHQDYPEIFMAQGGKLATVGKGIITSGPGRAFMKRAVPALLYATAGYDVATATGNFDSCLAKQ